MTDELHHKIMEGYAVGLVGAEADAAHNVVLAELANCDIDAMSVYLASSTYDYLTHWMHLAAYDCGKTLTPKPGWTIVDASQFPDEMAALLRLSDRLSFSDPFKRWMAESRHDFVNDLRRDPIFETDRRRWPSMTEGERADFVKTVVFARCASADFAGFRFAAPDFVIEDKDEREGACSTQENRIFLSRTLLSDDEPVRALEVAFHEGTHNLIKQMGFAMRDHLIQDTHPFFEDFWLAETTTGYKTYNRVPERYNADLEERLAWHEGKAFSQELVHGNGLCAKFRIASEIARETWRGHAPTVRQALATLRME